MTIVGQPARPQGIKKINLFFVVIPACRESFFLLKERFWTSQNDRIGLFYILPVSTALFLTVNLTSSNNFMRVSSSRLRFLAKLLLTSQSPSSDNSTRASAGVLGLMATLFLTDHSQSLASIFRVSLGELGFFATADLISQS